MNLDLAELIFVDKWCRSRRVYCCRETTSLFASLLPVPTSRQSFWIRFPITINVESILYYYFIITQLCLTIEFHVTPYPILPKYKVLKRNKNIQRKKYYFSCSIQFLFSLRSNSSCTVQNSSVYQYHYVLYRLILCDTF